MTAKNDITGDSLISKTNSESYRNNYDLIFGKKGKTNEFRTGRNDEQLVTTGENAEDCRSVSETDAYPHDRVPADSNH